MALERAIKTLAVIISLAITTGAAGAGSAEGQSEVAAAPPAPPPYSWKVNVGLSLIYLKSSAKTLTFAGTAAVERKIPDWIFLIKAGGAYGTSQLPGGADSQVVALAASLQARIDRKFSDLISVYVLGGIETDHVQSLRAREYGEGGISATWVDVKEADYSKTYFRNDLGFRYQNDSRHQYYPTEMDLPNVELVAPRIGAVFRYAFAKGTVFSEEAEVLPNLSGDARVLVNSTTKLTAALTGALSFATSYLVKYDSAPAPGKVNTETALTVGLEVAF